MFARRNGGSFVSGPEHVFRMIGSRESVTTSCKRMLAGAGFTKFTSYDSNFACTRQMNVVSGGELMLFVRLEMLGAELYEVTFQKADSSLTTVHNQMIHNRLSRVQSALEMAA